VIANKYIRILFCIGFFLLLCFNIKAQHHSLFGQNQTSWNVAKGNLWGHSTDSMVVDKDTTINNLNYKKVLFYDRIIGNSPVDSFFGFVREDTVNGVGYYFSTADSIEKIFINASLNIGDSFLVEGIWNSTHKYYVVDSVWSLMGKKHIRIDIDINPAFGGQWKEKLILIEGIGSNAGIGYQDNSYINNFPYLFCSYKDNNKVFNNIHPSYNQLCFASSVSIYEPSLNNSITIFPSPSTGKIYIQTDEKIQSILVLDLFGKVLFRGSDSELNLNLTPGLYLVEVFTDNSFVSKKIILN